MTDFYLKLPDCLEYCIDRLADKGFEAYVVGGCIRDLLVGRTPSDFDIATSARPDEIKQVFDKCIDTGEKYGTITVLVNDSAVEITTFRAESDYSDCRKPDNVIFLNNIEEDLSRRDFTVNAMAYNHSSRLIDPYGGRDDLTEKIIRCVGDPRERFSEDALRILRAYRFSSTLGFRIEENTERATVEKAGLLAKISAERIKAELDKILSSKKPSYISRIFENNILDCLDLTIANTDELSKLDDIPNFLPLRWTALVWIGGLSVKGITELLKFDNKTVSLMESYVNLLNLPPAKTGAQIKRQLALVHPDYYLDYLYAWEVLTQQRTGIAREYFLDLTEKNEPWEISMLAVDGNDLLGLGLKQGTEIGMMLEKLLELVIDNPSLNTRKDLLEFAKKYL